MFRELAVVVIGIAIGAAGGTYHRFALPGAQDRDPITQVQQDQSDGPTTTAPDRPGANDPTLIPRFGSRPGDQAGPPSLAPPPGGSPGPNVLPAPPPGSISPGLPSPGGPGVPYPPSAGPGQPPLGGPGLVLPPSPGGQPSPFGPGMGPAPFAMPAPGLPFGPGGPPMGGPGPGQPPGMNPMLPGGGFWPSTAKPTASDVAYGGDPLQRLDVYQPVDVKSAPVVLFVHGGGWSGGDKAQFGWVGEQLAREGILVGVVNYRLSPAVQHPAHAQDVAKAIAWIERNAAAYGGDPQRLSVVGHSAGAHLAALVALDPTYLQAEGYPTTVVRSVVGIAGAGYDLDAYYANTPLVAMLVSAFGQDPTRWATAAPVRYVQPAAPPFYLVHGLIDTSAPVSSTQTFAAALTRDGVPNKLELLPNEDHLGIVATVLPSVSAFVRGGTVDAPAGDAGRPPGARRRGA